MSRRPTAAFIGPQVTLTNGDDDCVICLEPLFKDGKPQDVQRTGKDADGNALNVSSDADGLYECGNFHQFHNSCVLNMWKNYFEDDHGRQRKVVATCPLCKHVITQGDGVWFTAKDRSALRKIEDDRGDRTFIDRWIPKRVNDRKQAKLDGWVSSGRVADRDAN